MNNLNPVKYLYPIPIYEKKCSIDEIFLVQAEIKKALPNIMYTDVFENPPGWRDGVRTNIKSRHDTIKDFKLENLGRLIDHHVSTYIELINAHRPVPVYRLHSWVNITGQNEYQDWHTHQDSWISGSYYYQTNGNDGDLEFDHPCEFVQSELFPFGTTCERFYRIRPAVGKIVLFPGWMKHAVNKNATDSERISISFNMHRDHFFLDDVSK